VKIFAFAMFNPFMHELYNVFLLYCSTLFYSPVSHVLITVITKTRLNLILTPVVTLYYPVFT